MTATLAAGLGLPKRGKRVVIGARGENMHALLDFDIGFLIARDPTELRFLDGIIQGMDWGGHPEFDVLLGMDVLSQCELSSRRDRSFTLVVG